MSADALVLIPIMRLHHLLLREMLKWGQIVFRVAGITIADIGERKKRQKKQKCKCEDKVMIGCSHSVIDINKDIAKGV